MYKLSLLLVVVVAVAGVQPASVPQEPVKQVSARPLMHPELRAGQGAQVLQCYEGIGQTGDSVRLIDYAPDLRQYNFNNRAASCCFTGIWILYDEYNFNQNNLQAPTFFAWGENYCTNLDSAFVGKASSVRHSGAPDGYKYDTLNFYEGEYFMGREQYLYGDAPQLNYDNLGRSLIVTGSSPWTLYQFDNYQGNCFCVYPSDMASAKPGFYPTAASLGGLNDQVSSVRRGCFCSKKVFAHKTFNRDGKIAHQGFFNPK